MKVIARWQSRGGRYWVELEQDELGFYYRGDGCSGNIGKAASNEAEARAYIQARIIRTAALREVSVLIVG